jgi:low temperature requirement protein LtrA
MTDDEVVQGERRATNLELFLDLVFVFGVAQVSVAFGDHLTWSSFGRAALLLGLLWWLWSQFAWLGTAIDLEARPLARVLVLATVAPAVLLGAAIPAAFEAKGAQFGWTFFIVQMWALGVQGWSLIRDRATWKAWLHYAPVAAIAPGLVLVGGLGSSVRLPLWIAAMTVNVIAAVVGGRTRDGSEWRIDPAHFSERHALFVIIALGEVLVAIGVAVSPLVLTIDVVLGVAATVLLAGGLWWSYFGLVSGAFQRGLRDASPEGRGTMARDVFTLGHFPLVLGITLYAHVAKHVVADPSKVLPVSDRVALFCGVSLLQGGFVLLRWRLMRRVTPQRLVAIGVFGLVVGVLGGHIAGWVTVGLGAVVIGVMQFVIERRNART